MNIVKVVQRSFGGSRCLRSSYWRIPSRSIVMGCPKINKVVNKNVSITTIRVEQGKRFYSVEEVVDEVTYERVCDETLESLTDYFEELIEDTSHLKNSDVTYGSGVLTVNFGEPYGTYVINRQTPNRQIWLSSPKSGPKRYDYVIDKAYWVYKHDNKSLHQLLQEEIKAIVKKDVNFSKCSYSLV